MRACKIWRTSSLGKMKKLKKLEEALPRLKKECELEKASRLYKEKTGVGCDGVHSKIFLDFDERNEKEKSWSSWKR